MSAASTIARCVIAALVFSAALHAWTAPADESLPVHRIGVLTAALGNSSTDQGLREGLRELGYIEGKTIVIEWRRSAAVNYRQITRFVTV